MIKILLVLGVVIAVAVSLRGSRSHTFLALRRIGIIFFSVIAIGSILFPSALTSIANAVGVGRGTDLLLYGLVVAVVFIALGLHHRVLHLEEQVRQLAREIALTNAEHQD